MNKESILALARSKAFQIGVASVLSAAAGGAGGYFFAKKNLRAYYVDLSNREIAAAKNFYGRLHKTDEDHDSPEKVLERLHGGEEEATTALLRYQGRAVVAEAPVPTEQDLLDKHGLEELPDPTDAPDPRDEINRNVFVDNPDGVYDYDTEVLLRTETAPYIITQEEFFLNEKEYEQTQCTFYAGDDTLVDEQEQVIPDSDSAVGDDHLMRFGYGSGDKNIVYVRNDILEMEFEIAQSYGSYAKEVLGFDDDDSLQHSNHNGLRKFRGHDD